jgi:hypothetical protein
MKPCVELLEDRCLLASYTWNGPDQGLWSTAANWMPKGVPGPSDTVIFAPGQKNSSIMDLVNWPAENPSYGRVGALKLQNASTINLAKHLDVGMFTMNSGVIETNSQILTVYQQGDWTDGLIIGDTFSLAGTRDQSVTFNVSGTPVFAARLWAINQFSTVNWTGGDLIVSPGKTIVRVMADDP